MLETKVLFIPVFYHVRPTNLRHVQRGVYANAFLKYKEEEKYLNKLEEWEAALYRASLFTGFEYNDEVWKSLLDIKSAVVTEVQRLAPLYVAKHPVGLDEIVRDFEAHCLEKGEEEVTGNMKIIGIFGLDGSGKTTLATDLFNRKRLQFDRSCFLYHVREGKLPSLQTKLLRDLFHEDHPEFQSINKGIGHLNLRLERNSFIRFLIVLDDVDHTDQLDALVPRKNLNFASLVIVTTRDERLLIRAGITVRYRMKEMSLNSSRELFCWHAFHQANPVSEALLSASQYQNEGLASVSEYENEGLASISGFEIEDLVESFIAGCGGLPLSLQVVGGHLYSPTINKDRWKLELGKFQKTLPREVKHKINISFDALDHEQKEIFMDIACFFVGMGKSRSMAIRIWEGSGWAAPEYGLQTLVDKCLVEMEPISISDFQEEEFYFRMHDHICDFGREMAAESTHSCRIWQPRDLESLDFCSLKNLLQEDNLPNKRVRCLHWILDDSTHAQIRYFIGNSDHHRRKRKRLLWMALEFNDHQDRAIQQRAIPSWVSLRQLWYAIPRLFRQQNKQQTEIPSLFPLQYLQGLEFVNGNTGRLLQNCLQGASELKELLLIDTYPFVEFPKGYGEFRLLENLILAGTGGIDGMLIEGGNLSQALNFMYNLRSLVFKYFRLSGELNISRMFRLEKIDIRFVKDVRKICISKHCQNLKFLHLDFLPDLIEVNLSRIASLSSFELDSCPVLTDLPGIADCINLANLNIGNCWELKKVPSLAHLHLMERIIIDGCPKGKNITGIEKLERLKYLYLSGGYGSLPKRLSTLSRLPSEFTTVIGRAVDGEKTNLYKHLFSVYDAVSEIHINDNGEGEASMASPHQLSAIIVCILLQISRPYQIIQIPIPPNNLIESKMPQGEWVVTIVVTDPQKLVHAERYIGLSKWIPGTPYEGSSIMKGWLITVNHKIKKLSAGVVFHRIMHQLYQ